MESMTFDLNATDAMGQFTLLADDGTPRTGLAYNTANLFATMSSPFGVVTLALEQLSSPASGSYQAPTAFNKVRFGQVDATNAPGVYEIHFSLDLYQFLLRNLVTFRGNSINLQTKSFEMYSGGVSVGNVNGGIPIAGFGPFPATSSTSTTLQSDSLIGFDGDPVVGRYLVNADQYTTAAITGFNSTTGTLTIQDQSELSVNGAWTKTPVAGNRMFVTAEPAIWRVQSRTLSATGNTAVAAAVGDYVIESGISASSALTNDSGTQLTGITLKQAIALALSALAGKFLGANTTSVSIKPAGKPSGNTRIAATVDANGNRTATTLKVPD